MQEGLGDEIVSVNRCPVNGREHARTHTHTHTHTFINMFMNVYTYARRPLVSKRATS
jgi:hypothetical protein